MRDHRFTNLTVCDHPLVADRIRLLRDRSTDRAHFREAVYQISLLMTTMVTADLPYEAGKVNTPLTIARGICVDDNRIVVTAILRAGLPMAEAVQQIIPKAAIAHIGVYRDNSSHKPVEYVRRLPCAPHAYHLVVDPMLATGGSAIHVLDLLKHHYGKSLGSIRMMALIAAPEGVAALELSHPDVHIFVAALDDRLDDNAYIVPGLGDAGDRLFGTGNTEI